MVGIPRVWYTSLGGVYPGRLGTLPGMYYPGRLGTLPGMYYLPTMVYICLPHLPGTPLRPIMAAVHLPGTRADKAHRANPSCCITDYW